MSGLVGEFRNQDITGRFILTPTKIHVRILELSRDGSVTKQARINGYDKNFDKNI
jgi:hypothetical protein